MTDDLIARLDAAHKLVSFWPERDMAPGAIEDLGTGFMNLLALRNLVPEAMTALADRGAQIERLTRERDERNKLAIERAARAAAAEASATAAERERDEARAEVEQLKVFLEHIDALAKREDITAGTKCIFIRMDTATALTAKGGADGEA